MQKKLKRIEEMELSPDKVSLTPRLKKTGVMDLGKVKLDDLLEESYKLAQDTKTGKKYFRFLTPNPPPVLKKIKNKSIMVDSPNSEDKLFAYVNFLNGKTEEMDLPSFKEYTKLSKKLHYETEKIFNKIDKCHEDLGNFEKKMNGLEYFCKFNPGVPWNNDKNMLLRLAGSSSNRRGILKSFNERNLTLGTRSSKRPSILQKPHSISNDKKPQISMPLIEEKQKSPTNTEKSAKMTEKFFTTQDNSPPNPEKLPQSTSKPRKFLQSPPKSVQSPQSLFFENTHLEDFLQSKKNVHLKTLKLFKKIQLERPKMLRTKAKLIFADKAKYKGKIHSFQQMAEFKRVMETDKLLTLVKCKGQVKLYTSLLEYLKDYRGMPKQSMITFVEAIKHLLESGWVLDGFTLPQLLSAFSSEEQEELEVLISMIQKYLSINN